VPGYLHNSTISKELATLPIQPGIGAIPDNLRLCYLRLCELKLLDKKELPLLEAWLKDLS